MQQAKRIQKIPEFSFGKELACDHALSLCLCNLFIFVPLEPKKREEKKNKTKQTNKQRITPDLRLGKSAIFFCRVFSPTELDWNSVMIEEGWDKTKIQNGGRNGTLEVGQFLDKSDA